MTRLPVVAASFVTLFALVTLSVTSALSKTPPGQSPPTNTAAPSISGPPAVGSTLQASTGSWQGRSISYSFQWQRCSSGSCAAISGATGSFYLVSSADVGDTLLVAVTAKNKFGSTVATSAPTAVVPSPTSGSSSYTNTALPAISGTAQAGQTLTVSNGSWSPTSSSFNYAWHRCQNGSCALSPTSANRASYSVQPGDVGYTILAQVAPGGDWSQSADSKPTATVTSPTPTPSPSGNVLFDGRAKLMTLLQSNGTQCGGSQQSPAIWDGLTFMNDDISLASDTRYGKAYKVTVPVGDHNPCNTSAPTSDGSGQLTVRRPTDYGKWDYYAIAVRVPSWSYLSDLRFADIASLGYETIQGDQVALRVKNNNGALYYSISQNSGQLTQTSTGWYAGSTAYEQTFMPVTYGAWEDFVVAVKWTADNTGGVEVYARNPGQTSSFTKVFSKLNEPTYATGCTNYRCTTLSDLQSSNATVLDKIGLYYGENNGVTPTQTVYESGLTRSSDLTTAQSTLP